MVLVFVLEIRQQRTKEETHKDVKSLSEVNGIKKNHSEQWYTIVLFETFV